MTQLSLSEVEHALLFFRTGRRLVLERLLQQLIRAKQVAQPFLLFSRLFGRLKSGDSILEKIKRKGIDIQSPAEIPDKIPDVLGFRVIVESPDELDAVDSILEESFDIVSRTDRTEAPDEFGGRGIEYSLRYSSDGTSYPFEVQSRTYLQHYWAARSFHLFHKQPRDAALAHKDALLELSELLQRAESLAGQLDERRMRAAQIEAATWTAEPLRRRVHLIVVLEGERFESHETLELSGDDLADHDRIVSRKLALYDIYKEAAIVEATCLNFSSFLLNEPHVHVPVERMHALEL